MKRTLTILLLPWLCAVPLLAQAGDDEPGYAQILREKFVEGNPAFMSVIALTLVVGLALSIERIVYLRLSWTDATRFVDSLTSLLRGGDAAGAREKCRSTRGPVAALCYHALCHAEAGQGELERSVMAHGSLLAARLERGCSWITLCITIAPSLGFLGTVIGMVMSFDQIEAAGDINPTVVAGGMKVALITTIFGIIVAIILQVFYNYILSRIDHLTCDMEAAANSLLDTMGEMEKG